VSTNKWSSLYYTNISEAILNDGNSYHRFHAQSTSSWCASYPQVHTVVNTIEGFCQTPNMHETSYMN